MPPAIIGAVVALGASAAAAYGLIAATTAMVIGALAMAAGSLLTKTPSFSDYTSQSERKQVLRSSSAALTRIYGTAETSGVLFFTEEEEGEEVKEWIHMALAVAGHAVDGCETIYLGDEEIGTFGELVSHELHSDRRTVDPFMLENCPSWKSDMIGVGITWLRVSMKFDAERFPSGLPNIKLVLRGARVYDPRDGLTKHSDNAALVILDYYRTALGVPDSDILWEAFKAAANLCDEEVTNADASTERRYTINGELDVSEAPAKILEAMHEACAGSPTYVAGKHGLLVGAYYGPAVNEIHDHQIIGNVEIVPETAFRDRVNTITGTFIDPGDHYSETDFPAVSVAQWVEEDGGEVSEDLDLRFVCSPYQAQRLANIRLRKKRSGRTIKLPMNFGGFAYRPGSYVRLYIPALGIAGAEFRVAKWEFAVTSGIKLTLQEESAEVWDDAIGQPFERAALTNLPIGGPAAPDNLTYTTEVVGEVVQGVLSWTNAGSQIAYNQVVVSRDGETVFTVQCPGQSCRVNGLAAGDYHAVITAVAVSGAHSIGAGITFAVDVPGVPVRVAVSADNWSITLRPESAPDEAFGTLFEVIWLPDGAAAQNLGIAGYLVHNGLKPDTEYRYQVRAVNAYGKSPWVDVASSTADDPSALLEFLSGEIGAEQLQDVLREQIESLPNLADQVTDGAAKIDRLAVDLDQVADGVNTLEQIVTGSDENLASRFESIKSSAERAASADLAAALTAAEEAKTRREHVGAITEEQKTQASALSAQAEQLETVTAQAGNNQAAIQSEVSARVTAVQSVSSRVDTVQASFNSSLATVRADIKTVSDAQSATASKLDTVQTSLNGSLATVQSDIQAVSTAQSATASKLDTVQTSLNGSLATVQSDIQAVSTAQSATASKVDTVQTTVGQHTSSIQTVQNTAAATDGKLSALWATKASVGGAVAGFGLEVSQTADGVLSSFLIDADVFAVLSRASGDNSKIHPFVVKDGTVYINKAVLDSADINTLVANYISVNTLYGVTITGVTVNGGTITGTNINGGSLNIGNGKATISSAGKATLQDADIIGKVTATSGTLRNLIVEESCDVRGTIYADKITGDVVKPYSIHLDISSISGGMATLTSGVTIPADGKPRQLMLMQSLLQLAFDIGAQTVTAKVTVDGSVVSSFSYSDVGMGINQFLMPPAIVSLSAGASHAVSASLTLASSALDMGSPYMQDPLFILTVSR